MENKKIVYVDMDNVLVSFPSAFDKLDKDVFDSYEEKDEIPGIFSLMEPMKGAIETYTELCKNYDVYILSTSPWNNPSAWAHKLEWVQKHLGEVAYKRLILTHHKNLNKGDFLIDDRTKNGASEFDGELIQFGSDKFPDWASVARYLLPSKKYKVTIQPLIGDDSPLEYTIEAVTGEEAKVLAMQKLLAEESEGFLLDNPGQILTAEEVV